MAHTSELLYQAYDTFTSVWPHIGNGDVNAYKLWGNFNIDITDEPLNGFVFCGFQKLMAVVKSNPALFDKLIADCSLIVVDEAHKASAPETKGIIDRIMTKKDGMRDRALIGLTATPGRPVNDDAAINRLITMFDNKPITIDTELLNSVNMTKFKAQNTEPERDIIKYFQDRSILAKITRYRLTYPNGLAEAELRLLKVKATANGYDDFTKEFLETIGRNKGRNVAILSKLMELNRDKIPTIVFACSVEHGKLLSTALTLEGIENACVFGDMNAINRAQAIRRFKDRSDSLNVLINYEVLTTGFDATNIKCVCITRPTQSVVLYSQMIGRGLRGLKMGGNAECLLVDIEDNLKKYNESMAFSYFDSYWNN
jgi:superfamily II DNA or RNA helicase